MAFQADCRPRVMGWGWTEIQGSRAFPEELTKGNAFLALAVYRSVYPSCKVPFGQQCSDPELDVCSPRIGSQTQQAASQTFSGLAVVLGK